MLDANPSVSLDSLLNSAGCFVLFSHVGYRPLASLIALGLKKDYRSPYPTGNLLRSWLHSWWLHSLLRAAFLALVVAPGAQTWVNL